MARRPNRYLTDLRAGETNVDFQTCRTLRHAWDVIGKGDRRPEFGTMICLRCVRCSTLRYDRYSRLTGERLGPPAYVWPDGYRDTEGHDSAWWRAQWAEAMYIQGLSADAEDDEVATKRRRKRA